MVESAVEAQYSLRVHTQSRYQEDFERMLYPVMEILIPLIARFTLGSLLPSVEYKISYRERDLSN